MLSYFDPVYSSRCIRKKYVMMIMSHLIFISGYTNASVMLVIILATWRGMGLNHIGVGIDWSII